MRKSLIAVAALLATITTAAIAVPTASASTDLVTCTGQEHVSWSPPLTNTPKDTTVTIDGKLGTGANPGSCLSTAGVSSASYHEVFTFPHDTCTTAGLNLPGSRVFAWDNGQTSTFTFTSSIANAAGSEIVTLTGTITAGRFSGQHAVETIQVPQLDPAQCAGSGAASDTAQAELQVLAS